MTLHLYPNVEHDSPEWHDLRRGIVTASVVGRLITPATIKVANNVDTRALTAELVVERITGWTDDNYVSYDMQRGHDDEPRAIKVYSEHWTNVTTCGFMVRDDWGFRIGYSPDGLTEDALGSELGCIEIKSRAPKKHLQTVLADEVPAENMAQIQCALLVSGRDWCDYISYSGGLALWPKRVYPDPRWQDAIVAAVAAFEEAAEQMQAAYTKAVAGLPMTERTPDYSDIRF
jgi:YqaJ-like viral recombinase domain.